MEEETVIPLVVHGCKLARDLEVNLHCLINQPGLLSLSCDEIARVFSSAVDRLNANTALPPHGFMISSGQSPEVQSAHGLGLEPVVQELSERVLMDSSYYGSGEALSLPESSGCGGGGGGGSISQRPRRRRKDPDSRTITVAAQMGNSGSEIIPPADGYAWRKYGQKEILGSKFPRGYFRCAYQRQFQCPGKKQVQRLDSDPATFEVVYRGRHTCTTSSSASPSAAAAAPSEMTTQLDDTTLQQPLPPSVASTSAAVGLLPWLSTDINPYREGTSVAVDSVIVHGAAGTASGGGTEASGDRYGRDLEYQPVVDLADAMFNSTSSSNNSMDLIFSPKEYKQ